MVDRRHGIVHEGDLNDHGRIRDIDGDMVSGQISGLRLFVTKAHDLTERRVN